MRTLYIIGNGFDRQHGLETLYEDFHKYLITYNKTALLSCLEKYFNLKNNWADFEKILGELDISQLISDERDLISDDDEPDSYTHAFGAKIYEICNLLTDGLKSMLNEWILTVNSSIHKCQRISTYQFMKDDFLLTFNYTNTLEQLYNISEYSICHIHGKAKHITCHPGKITDEPDIIIGHSYNSKPIIPQFSFFKHGKPKSVFSYFEGTCEVESYFNKSYKNTKLIIDDKLCYFENDYLSQFDKISIIGHSLSKVDLPYFQKISQNANLNVQYDITYCGDENKSNIINNSNMFLKNNNVNYINIK
jgi:hypothetical protein